MHLAVLSYPAAKPMIQLTIGNFTETPTPDSQRQNWSLAESRFA